MFGVIEFRVTLHMLIYARHTKRSKKLNIHDYPRKLNLRNSLGKLGSKKSEGIFGPRNDVGQYEHKKHKLAFLFKIFIA